MSVSSVGSTASVGFHGQVVGMDEMLDQVMRDMTNHINKVQWALRQIAAASEQDLDYTDGLKLSWAVDEDLLQMSFLADDLRGMCLDLITVPETPEEKAAARKFKIDRKEHDRKSIAEHNARIKADRETLKLARKAEKLAMVDEGE